MANVARTPERVEPDLYVYVVDASDAAVGSDDYEDSCGECCGTSRLDIQRGLLLPADTSDSPGELCLPLCDDTVKVALVVTAHGKATVALGPTTDAAALKATLRDLRSTPGATGGTANLRAALCLACLVARQASHPKLTAFVASPLPEFSDSDAEEVRGRLGAAALSICVLAPRSEVGDAAASVLETLPCGGGRLRWLAPPAASETAASSTPQNGIPQELWALKEASGAAPLAVRRIQSPESASSSSTAPSLAPCTPAAALRGTPPRGPLARNAFTCRDASLDTLLHLSRSGLLRQKLPTYSTLAGRVRGATAATGSSVSSSAGDCYVRVLAQPRYRTLVRLDVERWCNPERPAGPAVAWAPGTLRIVQDLKTPSSLLMVCSVDGLALPSARQGSLSSATTTSTATNAPLNLWATPSSVAAALADPRVSVPDAPPQNPVLFENFEYWVSGGASPFQVAFPLDASSAVTVRDLQATDSKGKTRPGRLVSFIMPVPAAMAAAAAAAAAAAGSGEGTQTEGQKTNTKAHFIVWVPNPGGQQQESSKEGSSSAAATTAAATAAATAPEDTLSNTPKDSASLFTRILRSTAANLDAAASGLLFLSPFLLSFTATLTARLVGFGRPQTRKALQSSRLLASSGAQGASAAATQGPVMVPLPLDSSSFFGHSVAVIEHVFGSVVSSPPMVSLPPIVSALRAAGRLSAVATVGPLDANSVAALLRYQAAATEQQGQQAAWDALKDRVAAPPGAQRSATTATSSSLATASASAATSPQFIFRGSVPHQTDGNARGTTSSAPSASFTAQEAPTLQPERPSAAAAAGLEVDSAGPAAVLVAKEGHEEVKLPLTPSAARDPPSLGSTAAAPPPPPSD